MKKEEDITEIIRKKLEEHKQREDAFQKDPEMRADPYIMPERRLMDYGQHKSPLPKKNNLKKDKIPVVVLIIAIIALSLAILSVIGFIFYNSYRTNERDLWVEGYIQEALVKDEKITYITLSDEANLEKASEVLIVFSARDDSEHPYQASYVGTEYEIYASDIGLESFENIIVVRVFFEYTSEPSPVINESAPTNTTNTTNTSSGGGSSGGGSGGGGGGSSCTPDCSGKECGNDGCGGSCGSCGENKTCINGACEIIPDCETNAECSVFANVCSYGICNSTGKCELAYNDSGVCRQGGECDIEESCDGSSESCPSNIFEDNGIPCSIGVCSSGICVECIEDSDCSEDACYNNSFLDYYCESNSCEYVNVTEEESDSNNNCNDGFDNDCDTLTDKSDSGCEETFPEDYVAYWRFEQETNRITPDETGLHNGTLIDDAAIVNDGQRGNVLSLDGEGDYVDLSNPDSFHVQTFTLCAWINNQGEIQRSGIFSDDISGENSQWELYVREDSGGVGALWYGPDQLSLTSSTTLQRNEWDYLAAVYDGMDIFIYINGLLEDSISTVNNPDYSADRTGGIGLVNNDWGRDNFNGSIDEVMIYNRSLSEEEIQKIYLSQGGEMDSFSPFVKFWQWVKNKFVK